MVVEFLSIIIYTDVQIISSNSSSVRVVLREDLLLQCSYFGVPVPSVKWFYNDVLLRNGVNGVSINTDNNISSILISAVERTSGGTYTCRANNTLGIDEMSYTVTVMIGKSMLKNAWITAHHLIHCFITEMIIFTYLQLDSARTCTEIYFALAQSLWSFIGLDPITNHRLV